MATVIHSAKLEKLAAAKDKKKSLIEEVGDISQVEVFGENLFIATYIGAERTAGGILLPQSKIAENEVQGNIGLVVKLGMGFENPNDGELFHRWVMFGYNDGLRFHYNGVHCRIMNIDRIRAIVPDPSKVL